MDLKEMNSFIAKIEKSRNKVFPSKNNTLKIGVDLGTAHIAIVVLDGDNNPIACETKPAKVLKDGIVVDYIGAVKIVTELKEKLEKRMGTELLRCAIAIPPNMDNSIKAHINVAEGAGFDVCKVLDEPSAANNIFKAKDGVIVDIGGGTTGLAILENGKIIEIQDEPTGGIHLTLVLAGSMGITCEEADMVKHKEENHKAILPVVAPVIEKMATIVNSYISDKKISDIYLCGGTCCINGIENIFEKITKVPTIKAENPLLVTPAGIAMGCE